MCPCPKHAAIHVFYGGEILPQIRMRDLRSEELVESFGYDPMSMGAQWKSSGRNRRVPFPPSRIGLRLRWPVTCLRKGMHTTPPMI
jgi:hypothetical protein